MRSLFSISVFVVCCVTMHAQKPAYTHSFPVSEKYQTTRSLFGEALDLTRLSTKRTVFQEAYPLSQSKISFSVLLWVKADKEIRQPYTILSSYSETKESKTGWKIGVQPNGA